MNPPQCPNLQFRGLTDLDASFERFVDDDMFGAKPEGAKIICPDDKSALSTSKETTKFTGVTCVIPVKDGAVWSAFVRIGNTELHRPAVKR